MLQLTNLLSQFEIYDSVEEAITAAYLGSRYSRGKAGDARPRMLCVFESIDVCTFLREVLCSAGYNALTTLSINDARILLKATKSKLVVLSSRFAIRARQTHPEDVGGNRSGCLSRHFGRELRLSGSRRSGREASEQREQPVDRWGLIAGRLTFSLPTHQSNPGTDTFVLPGLPL